MSMFMRGDKASENPASDAMPPEPAKAPAFGETPRTDRARGGAVPSLISAGLTVKGNLESEGEIQIDGEVEGDVKGKAVVIGEGAAVKGAVLGDSVTIAGAIEGKVEAATVSVRNTARIMGDIFHQALQIDSGAFVDGRCSPRGTKAEARSAAPKTNGAGTKAEGSEPEKAEAAEAKVH